MKHILIATDLSARSDRALDRALLLTREHEARLTILHVVDDSLPPAFSTLQEKTAKRIIDSLLEKAGATRGLSIAIETAVGQPYVEITSLARELAVDLIVIGMHRQTKMVDMFRGTTADRLIRCSPVPVLLVTNPAVRPYRRSLVGVDFSLHSKRAVTSAAELVPEGELHLLHAYSVPFAGFMSGETSRTQVSDAHRAGMEKMIEGELDSFLSAMGDRAPTLRKCMQEGSVRAVIGHQVERLEPDLLAIGTHGRTGVSHALLGSVAEDLLRDPPCDVLAVHAW